MSKYTIPINLRDINISDHDWSLINPWNFLDREEKKEALIEHGHKAQKKHNTIKIINNFGSSGNMKYSYQTPFKKYE